MSTQPPLNKHHRPPRHRRAGFTIVELLIVIIIIGLLAALLFTAVSGARIRAIDAQIIAEINQLDSAMKAHKEKYGAYPPDFNNLNRLTAHVRRMFPRYLPANVPAAFGNGSIDEAEALVLWLGGMSEQAATGSLGKKVMGFGLNPVNPFTGTGTQQWGSTLFNFDISRLEDEDNDGYYEYYPPHKSNKGDGVPPYVYFDLYKYTSAPASWPNYGSSDTSFVSGSLTVAQNGVARPYIDADGTNNTGMNADTFQIVCAGQDDNYGPSSAPLIFPTNIAGGHNDNLTNFTTSRLEESKQ